MDTRSPCGPFMGPPEYALAVSRIFTKATNQAIILNTPPDHVCSTAILWASLAHDKRFEQVPMSKAAPGDVIIGSGWRQGADGYAGIIVDHGRIVSNSSQGVRDNSSLLEIQRTHPGMTVFRYVGFWNYYRTKPVANVGFDPDEPRIAAGQPGGGQWTSGSAGGAQSGKGQLAMAPSTVGLSAGDQQTAFSVRTRPGPITKVTDNPALDYTTAYLGEVAEVWKGYGDAISDTVVGLFKAALFAAKANVDTLGAAQDIAKGATPFLKNPGGVLKAIGQQIAADFTSGDPRKAGELIGQVLISLAGTELSSEKMAALISKIKAAVAGEKVAFTAEEAELLQKALSEKGVRPAEKVPETEGVQDWKNPITAKPGQMQTIDPASVKAGEQTALKEGRIATQKSLIETGTPRTDGPPMVNEQGVVVQGHHHLRAAAEMGRSVDVKVVHAPEIRSVTGKPVTKLPTYQH